ncbi:SdpI family protein [Kordiimonas sp. SCSIO 12610]|uniref:SdpI family protein n=1 Tax=Kordiimonas sp. SCSIO 12610 TaxID=2829597 RepID=UPI002109528F|nr:SdpI family protein [Kordiimonas sp. SCSIO 12610]UTW56427.1 SdpI family protein [Kordiimonas sp. SCSIO 12610]
MTDDYQALKQEYDAFGERILVWASYGFPLLILLLSIPMILELVPPNGPIGFRTNYTVSSPEIWYAENHKAGIAFAITSIIGIFANYLILRFFKKTIAIKCLYSIFFYVLLLAIVISNLGP